MGVYILLYVCYMWCYVFRAERCGIRPRSDTAICQTPTCGNRQFWDPECNHRLGGSMAFHGAETATIHRQPSVPQEQTVP